MSGSDAELRSRAEELAYLEQRFDIHVMAFADQSEGTAQALQRAFSVDRATAQRMLEGTPVVVKRGATPEVASALLDELGRVGAQVVLLPSATKGSLPPDAARAASPSPKAPTSAPHAASSGPVKASTWGGLDLPSTPPASPQGASSLQEQLAGGFGGADDLEESLDGADDATGMPSDPAPEPELLLHASAPPALQRSRSARRASQEIDLDDGGEALEASRMVVSSPLRASTPPRPPRTPKPAGPVSPTVAPPPPPPPEPRRSLRPSDLGLNTVPPLPPRRSQVDVVPLSPSKAPPPALSVSPRPARGRPPPPAAPAPAPRLPAPVEPHLPPVPRGQETRRVARAPAAAATAASKRQHPAAEPARGAKRAAKGDPKPKQEQQRQPTGPVRTVFERDPFPAPTLSGPRGEFPVAPQPGKASPAPEPRAPEPGRADKPSPAVSKPAEPPARGLAVLMLLGSVLGVGLGIYVGDSVLQGLASPLSIALHGVALYGFGAGIVGLRS